MHLNSLLEIAADALGDRVAVATGDGGDLTYEALLARVGAVSRNLSSRGVERLVAIDVNSEAVPIGLFGAAKAGIPYVPVNYRLADAQLVAILQRAAPGLAVVEASVPARLGGEIDGLTLLSRSEFLEGDGPEPSTSPAEDPEDTAVLLFTSGTTGEPKAAVLRHRHLTSYVLETVEFMGAAPEDAALVSVPPYHIAGIAAVLTSVWSGRRLVYLPSSRPRAGWTPRWIRP